MWLDGNEDNYVHFIQREIEQTELQADISYSVRALKVKFFHFGENAGGRNPLPQDNSGGFKNEGETPFFSSNSSSVLKHSPPHTSMARALLCNYRSYFAPMEQNSENMLKTKSPLQWWMSCWGWRTGKVSCLTWTATLSISPGPVFLHVPSVHFASLSVSSALSLSASTL